MDVDSGNSLTALYHERWPMTGRKPGTIFVPTGSNQFFPRVPFAFHRQDCRRRGTGGAVPAQGGHGAKARGRGEGHGPWQAGIGWREQVPGMPEGNVDNKNGGERGRKKGRKRAKCALIRRFATLLGEGVGIFAQ